MVYNYQKKKFYIIQAIVGLVLFLIGLALTIFTETQTPSFAMMLGGTFFLTGLLSALMLKFVYTPKELQEEKRKESIDSRDERNTKIREKSAWATQRVMLIVLCVFVVLVTFILPFNLLIVISGWVLLIANAILPYIFAYAYSKRV